MTDNENVMAVKSCKSIEDELSLIDRLKGERDCYKNELKYANIEKEALNKLCGEQKAEIERLKYKVNKNGLICQVKIDEDKLEEIKNDCLERVEYNIKEIEAKAIKKFAHQLKILLETKAKLYSLSDKDCEFAIVQSTALKTVDNLVKERVGDEE